MQTWYRGVEPLDRNKHAQLKLASKPDFRFAAAQVALPLCLEELALAAPFYPIVFATGEQTVPLAVTGLHRDQNLFVDEQGQWAADVYVPAVVRNYPFVLIEAGEGRELVGVDAESSLLGMDEGQSLFEGGEPTEIGKQRLGLCLAFRDSMRKTIAFGAALREADCLEPQQAQIALPDGGERLRLDGFATVSARKLDQLPDETFLQWRHEGWLSPLYYQQASAGQWRRLIEMAASRQGSVPAQAGAAPQDASTKTG